ncbi:hypothetical protein DERF_004922 [Dermatophagoides farinae]|uniref:Uncharacterized protein n=1 Tax=Dermatophagoides farinae TaxID=6954 RepID=A0A922I4V3_DERFA|nr:hypothetical protein DERF_004922 [Dermatophagoides farinae]
MQLQKLYNEESSFVLKCETMKNKMSFEMIKFKLTLIHYKCNPFDSTKINGMDGLQIYILCHSSAFIRNNPISFYSIIA